MIVYLIILIFILCLFLVVIQKQNEPFLGGFINGLVNDSVSNFGKINREVENVGRFWNGIAQDWIPNVGWVYRYRDKSIEQARANRGLPPLRPVDPSVNIKLDSNYNRYTLGMSP